jgi:hypothetical protein
MTCHRQRCRYSSISDIWTMKNLIGMQLKRMISRENNREVSLTWEMNTMPRCRRIWTCRSIGVNRTPLACSLVNAETCQQSLLFAYLLRHTHLI